ncbi:MAG: alkaline phosphatase family protein [Chloroflexota bacterium]|nr:alkaline phosphatase family protein [Chloroflexota bacterium]
MLDDRSGLRRLERLFRSQALSRRQFIAGLTALGMSTTGIELFAGSTPMPAEAQVPVAQYLCLIVLDAFRPDYMSLAPMPSLSALMQSGASYDRAWVAQLESETPTGHATISTGAVPRRDGLIGFEWRDPTTGQEVLDGWSKGVIAGNLERDLRQGGTSSIPLAVKADDPKAKVVALSSEKVYAADAMGGWAADYVLYHRRGTQNDLIPAALPNHTPPADFFNHPNLQTHYPMHHFTDWDYLSAMLALAAIQQFKPKVLMVNMPGADVYGHPYGGPASPTIFKLVVGGLDRNIGRIVQAYKQAGIYEQTLFVITADHGMVPNDRFVAGSATKQAVSRAGGQYMFHTGGTCADIYLHNPPAAPNVAKSVAGMRNVVAAYARDPVSFIYERAAVGKIDVVLDDVYRFLLDTFAGPTSPDVVAPFRENTIGSQVRSAHGDHGGLNWGAQHVPLILSGPGVRSGTTSQFPARLVDIAPTVLRLLGLTAPGLDGIVLADALDAATAEEVSAQSVLTNTLTAYQDALITQSIDNIAQDKKLGSLPPPSLPARP